MPPFARIRPPSMPQLHEEHELIWDDGVSPETCIDFDVPWLSISQGLSRFAAGLSFFALIGGLVYLSDPAAGRPYVLRAETLPKTAFDPSAEYREAVKAATSSDDNAEEEED
ncbi:unnamed protein product [Phaeothamnion confervicola]